MLVAHCPGHGTPKMTRNGDVISDPGCVRNGIVERDLVLAISRAITDRVSWVDHLLLRDSEHGEDYSARARKASNAYADLVLCHHVNTNADPAVHRLMTHVAEHDKIGREVGEAIDRAAPWALYRAGDDTIESKSTDWTRRARWVIDHYLLYEIPTVLIEWGFSTNVVDAEYLKSEKSLPAIVACAGVGIARAMELVDER